MLIANYPCVSSAEDTPMHSRKQSHREEYAYKVRATTADGAFEFWILERSGKIIAQVYRRSTNTLDFTGKADRNPNWEFASIDEAKEWAERHLAEVLKIPGRLHWG